jgi:sugar phosphate isomerase/epimerase
VLLGLHNVSIIHTNLATLIRVARDLGYDAIEIMGGNLERYLAAGYTVEDLLAALGPVRVAALNNVSDLTRQEPQARAELLGKCARLCSLASELGCPIVPVSTVIRDSDQPWAETRRQMGESLAELADIAAPFDVRLAIEPQAFSPVSTLSRALEVVDAAGRDNVGIIADTFHLWAGGTPWDEVAAVDPSVIFVAHISDANPRRGPVWSDHDRDVVPGDGILPVAEGVAAIRAAGYEGLWTPEVLGAYLWERDPVVLARELKSRAEALLAG